MNAYIYAAALWCEDCGKAIQRELRPLLGGDFDENDEGLYDSDDYPKGPYPDGGGDADCPQHCDGGEACANALFIPEWGRVVGAWLENDLTEEGVRYVEDAICEDPANPVTRLWSEWYTDSLAVRTCTIHTTTEVRDALEQLLLNAPQDARLCQPAGLPTADELEETLARVALLRRAFDL